MDMGASVIARLINKAKETGKPFQLHLQLFCQEEFLRRLKMVDLAFGDVIVALNRFLQPVWDAVIGEKELFDVWPFATSQ